MKKKFVYPFFAVFLIVSLVACSENSNEPTTTIEKKEKETHSIQNVHWSYEGETGPEHWGELEQTNSICVNGSEQSPINIEFSQVKAEKNSENIQIQYESTPFTLVNNGHTVQANATTENNSLVVEGNEYKLVQLHFHTPSEHLFNGQNFDM